MLYVFHGTNTSANVAKATSLITSLRTKKADASYVRIEAGQWSPTIVQEHAGGQGLFANKYIVFLDRVTENNEAKDGLVEQVSTMQESPNIFIVLEGKVNAELTKAFEKHAEKVVATDAVLKVGKNSSRDEFNIFSLADAIGSRDSFKAWTVYRQAIDAGIETESIVGTIFWQLKSMALAVGTSSAAEAGLSPFVYSKAKKAVSNYSREELDRLTASCIRAYHDGHRGKVNMELGVERLILSLAR